MGAELRDVPGQFSFRDTKEYLWDPPRPSPGSGILECPALKGFYSFRGFLSRDEARAIASMAGRMVCKTWIMSQCLHTNTACSPQIVFAVTIVSVECSGARKHNGSGISMKRPPDVLRPFSSTIPVAEWRPQSEDASLPCNKKAEALASEICKSLKILRSSGVCRRVRGFTCLPSCIRWHAETRSLSVLY